MTGPMLLEALSAMRANRLRSFLTMLGMIIGVGAVIAMLAIGAGVQRQVQDAINAMGNNLFIVMPGTMTSSGVRMGMGGVQTLTADDAYAIRELGGVKAVAPMVGTNAQLVYGGNNWATQVTGSTEDFFVLRDWRVISGSTFDQSDLRSANQVAVLGQVVAANLFGEEDPVGKTIRIKGAPYLVLGVLARKGQSLMGQDQDDTVIVPLTTAQRKLTGSRFRTSVRNIMVQTTSQAAMPTVERGLRDLLRQRHRLSSEADDDFTVQNLTAVAETAAETTRVLSFMLGAIASISLLVGGIGIMNIMLVSVTERTREIGIRMAVGARRRDIRLQFLLEAVIISVAGCLLGVLLGMLGAWLVSHFFDTTVVVTLSSILLAFGVATAIGVFFGFYPADKAARLKPIEALRFQ
ncbi:MAG: ABC transporter permease [Pseudomonadota bacterium]